ncbi:MAG: hypothetical protein EHM45_14225 [Desulfobacteraceae bacterium]|nr:MAG: hypothetical protein EHM45_14225 [Desulfobacteraceae bacterium]
MESKKQTLFAEVLSQKTLDLIGRLNREHKSTFLIPTRFISAENAQLAYLVDAYCNHKRQTHDRKIFRSFFVSSRYEALQGAIKLIRHNGLLRGKKGIWILDPEKEFNFLINPLNQAREEDFLIPGLKIATSFGELQKGMQTAGAVAGVILRNTGKGLSVADCADLIERSAEQNIITLWDDPDLDLQGECLLHQLRRLPDMVIFGESLTEYQIPFVLFSMSAETHAPWAKTETCLNHTSTYAGNKLVVTKARDIFLEKATCISENREIKETCRKIEEDPRDVFHYFAKHVNPGMVTFYNLIGYDFICQNGHGSKLNIRTRNGQNKEVIDVVSGGGAAIRRPQPDRYYPKSAGNL